MPDLFVANNDKSPTKTSSKKEATPHISEAKLKKLPIFASFALHPVNLEFEHQEPDEQIHLFLRRHFITNLHWIISFIVGLFLPLAFFFLSPLLSSINLTIPPNYLFIITIFYYLILTGYVFINFITWYYNVGIITNLRVVDIDIENITSKNVATTGLVDIVDVEYSQSGFIQNLFDYGNVHMQTEGLKENFEFLTVPNPAEVTDIISDLVRARETKNG